MDYFKFFKTFTKLNVFLFSFIPENFSPAYLDYYFYCNKVNLEINKLILLNYISLIYFQNYNNNIIRFKLNYFLNFNKMISK